MSHQPPGPLTLKGSVMNIEDFSQFKYDSKTGDLWKKVGSPMETGHLRIKIGGTQYLVHRLVWFLHYGKWPSGVIDHIDGNPQNNSIENLREATRKQNAQNIRKPRKDSALSTKGVRGKGVRFVARIMDDRKRRHIGTFDTIEEASAAYWEAKKELHEFCPCPTTQ